MKNWKYFMCDFETTVYSGQEHTEVWASACVELFKEDVHIFNRIDEQIDFLINQKANVIAYFHNLKFDGSFILSYLLTQRGYKQACDVVNPEPYLVIKWQRDKDMRNNTVKYSISDRGLWYSITFKAGGHIIQIRDSLKLLPFSVKRIGESFKTKHKKLDMEYVGFRYAGCEIKESEKTYITNDILVPKEALEIMFKEGHDNLTIGSCCLAEFFKLYDKQDRENFFPNVYQLSLNEDYGSATVGDYVRHSYRGGWCYLVKGKENKIFNNGTTADVNSLYPSMMHSESGNRYPVGKPMFWKGDYIPEQALKPNKYYFIRIRTRFYLKPNKLPFIQIKNNLMYKGTESLETSDYYDRKTGKYYQQYKDMFGNICDTKVTLTLTMSDWELIQEHYDLVDTEILDGCYFYSAVGLFDEYINKYKQIKMTSKGALRELAKLFLNNLYGKFATSTDSSFKYAYVKEDGSLGYLTIEEHDKEPGYIPIGSAITSYSRCFTIRAAQKNYHGKNKRGFIYADTDSIHCDLTPNEIKGIKVHDSDFCCWKLESQWDEGWFVRQKTYIEHVVSENLQPVNPYNNIKCAGLPKKCKDLFELSLYNKKILSKSKVNKLKYTEEDYEFLKTKRTIEDFKIGIKIPGKLLPKTIKGGIVLVDTTYEMR